MKITSSRFVLSAFKPEDEPTTPGPDVVFLGRSNVGKSSLINGLLGEKGLARTSSQPGRTQSVNFYRVNEVCHFVDLPGYGFAKVPLAVKREWTKQLENYLQKRESLRGLILLMDVRHPMQPFDQQMLNWALEASMPVHILLTKADKLKRGPASSALLKVRSELKPHGQLASVQLFSAMKHSGHEALIKVLNAWLTDASVYEDDVSDEENESEE